MPDPDSDDAILLHPHGCLCGNHTADEAQLAHATVLGLESEHGLAANGKPILTEPEIVAVLTRTGDAWTGVDGDPRPKAGIGTITFAFFETKSQVYSDEKDEFRPLTAAQRDAIRTAFAIWGDFLDVRFVEGSVAAADINIGNLATRDTHYSAYANMPGTSKSDGDIWFNMNASTHNQVGIGQGGFWVMLHEIGHALGLSHPGNYRAEKGVTLTYEADAEYYQDSNEYTIMSYFSASATGAKRVAFAATPLADDIAAMQTIYGANNEVRTGDTVYGWNSNADRSLFDFAVNNLPVVAIWDTGGIDTLDFSGWTTANVIDLAEGGFSDGGGQASNIQITRGTVIENAVGGGGNDLVLGNAANNVFFLQRGGNDDASGLDGNDAFYFGAALDGFDRVKGGAGADTLAIQGAYANLVLGDVTGVEVLLALPGNDTRFGYNAGGAFSYKITANDGIVAAGQIVTVSATTLRPGENLHFDGKAETDGAWRIFAGAGSDALGGGKGSDGFFFGADRNLTGADRIDGGAGIDSLALRGRYAGVDKVAFVNASFVSVEVLVLLSGHSNEYGGPIVEGGFDYDLAMADGNVAAGQRLDVIATGLRADESLAFDGRAERDGSFRILSGAGADHLRGGAGADLLSGGGGADRLDGGPGGDTYIYRAASESPGAGFDTIFGFDPAADRIDLPGDRGPLDAAIAAGSLSAASFDANLAAAVGTALGAGEALLFTPNEGDFAGRIFLVADGNGAAGYQAGLDYVIELAAPAATIGVAMDFFI